MGASRRTLKGEAILSAAPNNRSHVVELSRGQWVEVTFKAVVEFECASNHTWACPGFSAHRNNAQLTAHWSEWLFTRQGAGCKVVSGAYKSREIASRPLDVVFGAFSPLEGRKSTVESPR